MYGGDSLSFPYDNHANVTSLNFKYAVMSNFCSEFLENVYVMFANQYIKGYLMKQCKVMCKAKQVLWISYMRRLI